LLFPLRRSFAILSAGCPFSEVHPPFSKDSIRFSHRFLAVAGRGLLELSTRT
jgi:hypothetical protein